MALIRVARHYGRCTDCMEFYEPSDRVVELDDGRLVCPDCYKETYHDG